MIPRYRWLLHKAVEDHFSGFFTFSVGAESFEQVVVCRNEAILRRIQSKECTHEKSLIWARNKFGIGEPLAIVFDSDRPRKFAKMKTAQNLTPATGKQVVHPTADSQAKRTSRRPDIQLYVPRARRSGQNPTDSITTTQQPTSSQEKRPGITNPSGDLSFKEKINPATNELNLAEDRCQLDKTSEIGQEVFLNSNADSCDIMQEGQSMDTITAFNSEDDSAEIFPQQSRQGEHDLEEVLPDRIDTESQRISEEMKTTEPSHSTAIITSSALESGRSVEFSTASDFIQEPNSINEVPGGTDSNLLTSNSLESEETADPSSSSDSLGSLPTFEGEATSKNLPYVEAEAIDTNFNDVVFTEDTAFSSKVAEDLLEIDCRLKEKTQLPPSVVTAEIILKEMDSVSRPSPLETERLENPTDIVAKDRKIKPIKKLPPNPVKLSPNINKEKASSGNSVNSSDSWDALFDENGDCLDPSVKEGLADALGKNVEIYKAKIDYLSFQPLEPDLSDGTYDHILELYDFPVDFKTQNLVMAFSAFKDRGFDIKWVDDTHALAIFSSPIAAAQALELQIPFIKVRTVSQGIGKSKSMVSKQLDYLLPARPRPETSASLARRMITGALGMRSQISKEQRESERHRLQIAKENKRQVAKQKQDIWNGTVT